MADLPDISQALSRYSERWNHPPVDPRDVAERLAIRYEDRDSPPFRVVRVDGRVRLFLAAGERWVSAYVHDPMETDAIADRLTALALDTIRIPQSGPAAPG